jgi:hypothetical protein
MASNERHYLGESLLTVWIELGLVDPVSHLPVEGTLWKRVRSGEVLAGYSETITVLRTWVDDSGPGAVTKMRVFQRSGSWDGGERDTPFPDDFYCNWTPIIGGMGGSTSPDPA